MVDFVYEKAYTDDVEFFRDIASIAQSITTMLAIVVSGFWGYWVFVKNRQQYPRANLSQSITHRKIDGRNILLHVVVIVQNVGEILLCLRTAETRIQKVLPLPKPVAKTLRKGENPVLKGETEINAWPLLGCHETGFQENLFEIEPGETQELHHDFVIPSGVKTILVYSYLKNIKKRNREIGWNTTTYYDIN